MTDPESFDYLQPLAAMLRLARLAATRRPLEILMTRLPTRPSLSHGSLWDRGKRRDLWVMIRTRLNNEPAF